MKSNPELQVQKERRLRTLIVDDEPLARDKLRRLVLRDDRLVCVGEAKNGREALDVMNKVRPDLMFLDIRMPTMSGIDVADVASPETMIVFTTAFEEYAVTAFELQAIDYLLKPFGKVRFEKAVDRICRYGPVSHERFAMLPRKSEPLRQIFVRERGKTVRVPTADIVRIKAAGDYSEILTDQSRHLVSVRMKELEDWLDPNEFIRIHRSTFIRLDRVRTIEKCYDATYEVFLVDGTMERASRSGAARLRDVVSTNRNAS